MTDIPPHIKHLLKTQYAPLSESARKYGSRQLREQLRLVNKRAQRMGWDIYELIEIPKIKGVIE
jgi:hypothetical protein